MDDQWSVLQSGDKTARSSTPHPMCRLASGPKRVPNLLGALLFSMSETGRKCFQLGSQQSTPAQIALGLRNSADHVRFALVSQFVGHRLCDHRRNVELRLDIDLVSVGDRINVLIIVLQMGCWELGD